MKNSLIVIAAVLAAILLFTFYFRQKIEQPLTQTAKPMNKTFAIIKPHAVEAGKADEIISIIKDNGFEVLAKKELQMTEEQAKKFYDVHKERPFFGELVEMMTSGPVIVMVLQKDNAVKAWRDLMGATNPAEASEGTIRKQFGVDIGQNATHGSDSEENARIEIAQFFPNLV